MEYSQPYQTHGQINVKLQQAETLLLFVGTVINELSQPLTVVVGLADLLLAKVHPDDPITADLTIIAKQAKLIGEMVKAINYVADQEYFSNHGSAQQN